MFLLLKKETFKCEAVKLGVKRTKKTPRRNYICSISDTNRHIGQASFQLPASLLVSKLPEHLFLQPEPAEMITVLIKVSSQMSELLISTKFQDRKMKGFMFCWIQPITDESPVHK